MANPIQGGARVLSQQSGDRKTALALVLAIAAAEMLLSGTLQGAWKALWGPTVPLGAKSAPASAGSTAPAGNAASAGATAAGG